MTNPTHHTCDCGYSWPHGVSGKHRCAPYYQATIKRLQALVDAKLAREDQMRQQLNASRQPKRYCNGCRYFDYKSQCIRMGMTWFKCEAFGWELLTGRFEFVDDVQVPTPAACVHGAYPSREGV